MYSPIMNILIQEDVEQALPFLFLLCNRVLMSAVFRVLYAHQQDALFI